jgi:hypothetical protein
MNPGEQWHREVSHLARAHGADPGQLLGYVFRSGEIRWPPMSMWKTYRKALAQAEEEWTDGDTPVEVTAVAKATGMDPAKLWDEVEGVRGWESHD